MRHLYSGILAKVGVMTLCAGIAAGSFTGSNRGAAQTPSPTAERKVTLKSAAPTLTTALQLTMMARHFDEAHGITVDLQAGGTSSTILIAAVLSGQADFASPGTPDALQAIRQGANLNIIAVVANNLQVMVIRNDVMKRLGVSPTAPVADRVRALKGLTIATGAVGSTHYQILRTYLKQYGVDPDKEVKLVGLGEASALITGIEHERYDAIANASGIVEQAVADNAATIWISGPRGDISDSGVKTCVIVVRGDTLEKRRADVDAFRAALEDALHAVQRDHAATGVILRDTFFPKLNPAVWDLAWNGAIESYPSSLAFTRAAYDYWVTSDPKGPDSYRNVDYSRVTYASTQSQ
jgi:NitT/TauT family transport system substrate-binding protein